VTPPENWSSESEPLELLGLIGSGGFAHTWKAKVLDEDLLQDWGAEIVAVKIPLGRKQEHVLTKEVERNGLLHQRLKEVQAANLVRYMGFCVFRGQIVMTMQFVPGGSLRGTLGPVGAQKPLPVDQAVEIAEGILAGLSVIHRERVFHRDIKPENILMDGRVPKISDLGISRLLDSHEQASQAGTLFYMSPELLSVTGASFPSDIWSLGVTFYEMVTGRIPFGDLTTPLGVVVNNICAGPIRPPREYRPDLPVELERIILKALERRVEDRFRTPDDMLDTLRAWRRGSVSKVNEELEAARELMSSMEPPPGAEEKLKRLLAKYPDDPKAYQYLGEYYNRCERPGDAIAVFQDGLKRAPDNALLHWDLALSYQRKGRKADAAAALERALTLGLDASLQRHASMLLKALKAR
jgi:serine/threonine protein kinase